ERREGALHELCPGGDDLVGDERRCTAVCRAAPCLRGQQRGLAARAGAEIEPPLPRGDGPYSAEGERRELGALVLHACAPLPNGRPPGRISPLAHGGEGREQAWCGPGELVGACQSGQGHETHARRAVVGLEERGELVLAALG